MNEGILGAIANPQLADVKGALDYRRSQMDKDEAKRKELRMNQFIAESLPNLEKGSTLYQMAVDDPKTFAMFAKMRGIPLNDGEAMEKHRSTVGNLALMAKDDPKKALEHARMLQQENIKMGVKNKPIDEWVALADKDPITAFNALYMENQSLNPVKADVISAEKQAELDLKREEFEWKKANPNAGVAGGGATLNQKDFDTWQRLKREGNPDAEGFARSKGFMPSWGSDAGTISSSTTAKEDAKNAVKYKETLFDSINNGNRTLNKYEMAIEQIDKGAESGPVMKMLPSLQDSTLLVDTIRKDIGMEIVGSGVLGVNPTDADVKLAMEVAIPEGLRPDVLKKEIKRRAQVINDLNSAQREYYRMLDSGKTKGDILRMAEEKRTAQKVKPAGSDQIKSLLEKY